MSDTKVMHRRQLVDEVAQRSGCWDPTRQQVRDALHGILNVITDEIAEGNAVAIDSFGHFEVKEHRGRPIAGRAYIWPWHACAINMTNPTKDGIMPPNLTQGANQRNGL